MSKFHKSHQTSSAVILPEETFFPANKSVRRVLTGTDASLSPDKAVSRLLAQLFTNGTSLPHGAEKGSCTVSLLVKVLLEVCTSFGTLTPVIQWMNSG